MPMCSNACLAGRPPGYFVMPASGPLRADARAYLHGDRGHRFGTCSITAQLPSCKRLHRSARIILPALKMRLRPISRQLPSMIERAAARCRRWPRPLKHRYACRYDCKTDIAFRARLASSSEAVDDEYPGHICPRRRPLKKFHTAIPSPRMPPLILCRASTFSHFIAQPQPYRPAPPDRPFRSAGASQRWALLVTRGRLTASNF